MCDMLANTDPTQHAPVRISNKPLPPHHLWAGLFETFLFPKDKSQWLWCFPDF